MFGKFKILSLVLTLSSVVYADVVTTPLKDNAESTMVNIPTETKPKTVVKVVKKLKPRKFTQFKYVYGEKRAQGLDVSIHYLAQTQTDSELSSALSSLYSGLDLVKLKSTYQAEPVEDISYGVRAQTTELSPYVAMSLHQKLTFNKSLDSGACDLGSVGPCIVLERDSALGDSPVLTAYYVGTAPDVNDPNLTSIFRIPANERQFSKEINSVLANKTDGIYVYSNATSAHEAEVAKETLLPAPAVVKAMPSQFYLETKGVKFEGVKDEDQEAYANAVQELIQRKTITLPEDKLNPVGQMECAVSAKMQQQRQFVGFDVHSFANLWRNVKTYSRKSTVAHLTCNLRDGRTVEKDIPVSVKEWGVFIWGVVTARTTESTLSFGLGGVANGAGEILAKPNHYFPLAASVRAGYLAAGLTPVIVSAPDNNDGIYATRPELTVGGGFGVNAELKIFGGMVLQADLNAPDAMTGLTSSN